MSGPEAETLIPGDVVPAAPGIDDEIAALKEIAVALDRLDDKGRARVLGYFAARYNVTPIAFK